MKKLAVLVVAAIAAGIYVSAGLLRDPSPASSSAIQAPAATSETPTPGSRFEGRGTVVRILPDDTEGSRHQRFIVRIGGGRTLLIAHNIDLAPRVEPLAEGDTVEFAGTYEWNPKGGVVHWTHHDPSGRHGAGWIRRDGRTFQ